MLRRLRPYLECPRRFLDRSPTAAAHWKCSAPAWTLWLGRIAVPFCERGGGSVGGGRSESESERVGAHSSRSSTRSVQRERSKCRLRTLPRSLPFPFLPCAMQSKASVKHGRIHFDSPEPGKSVFSRATVYCVLCRACVCPCRSRFSPSLLALLDRSPIRGRHPFSTHTHTHSDARQRLFSAALFGRGIAIVVVVVVIWIL